MPTAHSYNTNPWPPPARLQQLVEDQRVLQTEVMRSGDASCNLPVNLKRMIENTQRKFECRTHKRGPTGGWSEGRAAGLQDLCALAQC